MHGVSRPPFWVPGYFAAAWAVWPRSFRPDAEVPPPARKIPTGRIADRAFVVCQQDNRQTQMKVARG